MKKQLVFFVMLGCVIFQNPSLCFANRHALVIGNGDYQDARLRTPINDAYDMESTLRDLDFVVRRKIDATHEEMEEAIREFEGRLSPGDTSLFYFSGYGVQVDGTNYLIPVGAGIYAENEIKYKAVNVDMVLDKLRDAGSRINIVILEACRNNPFSFYVQPGLVDLIEAPENTRIAYAAAPGKTVAYDGSRNSLYTQHLLREITKPGLGIVRVFRNVRDAVKSETHDDQVPRAWSSLREEFFFTPQTVTPEPSQLEQLERDFQQRGIDVQRSGERLTVKIRNSDLFFEDSDGLKSGAQGVQVLNKIVNILIGYRNIRINVEGHTGTLGHASNNLNKSKRRAKKVEKYFEPIQSYHEIDSDGYGEELEKGDVLILIFSL
jgi:outer membrane protein OmpA-like peptidoglycan-associated protein